MDAFFSAISTVDSVGGTSAGSSVKLGSNTPSVPTAAPTEDFGAVLADMASGVANTVAAGEAAALAGMKGQMPVQKVVEAVMNAEQTLQSAIAVRDKALAAYLEISRMQI